MPTEINFPPTSAAMMTRYLSYNEDPAGYGDINSASPPYTGWLGVTNIELNSDIDFETVTESGSGLTYYRAVDKARNFNVNIDFVVADIPMFQWATTATGGAATLDRSRTFMICRKVNSAGTLTEAFQLLRSCKPSALEFGLKESGLIGGRMTLATRLISEPTTTQPLTTPTLPALGSISLPIWRHIDAGTNAITHNAVAYPMSEFNARWDYKLAIDRAYGSELIDYITVTGLSASGNFVSKSFKNFLLGGYLETGAIQTNKFAANVKLKSGSSKLVYTDMVLTNLRRMLEYGGENTQDDQIEFTAPTCVVDAVG